MGQRPTPSLAIIRPAVSARGRRIVPYLASLLVVAGATAIFFPVRSHLNPLNITLLFLIVVTGISLRVSTGPSIVASVAAFLCIDFFFIPPVNTFGVAETDHVLALVVFLGIAVLLTQLVVRVRARTSEALRRGRQTATLHELSAALIGQIGVDDTLVAIVKRVHEIFALDTCAILLLTANEFAVRAVEGKPIDVTDRTLLGLARWVVEQRQPAGLGRSEARLRRPGPAGAGRRASSDRALRGQEVLLLPIVTNRQPLGVLLLTRRATSPRFDGEERQLLATFANQAAIAIERSLLTDEQTRAAVVQRSDELKSALLSAVSHDLRTPLASIKASVTSLLQSGVVWSERDRRDLLTTIDEEADRLDRLVANLLDLSRIEAGALQPDLDWNDLAEVIGEATDRTVTIGHQSLVTQLDPDLPLLRFDYVEIVQVLVNLLQNAVKYSPAGGTITVRAWRVDDEVEVAVRDEGIGIPPGEEERVFDTFYRVESPRRTIGSGVGLAICRGIVEAHGGRIWAERNREPGTTFRFRLPVPVALPAAPERPVNKVLG